MRRAVLLWVVVVGLLIFMTSGVANSGSAVPAALYGASSDALYQIDPATALATFIGASPESGESGYWNINDGGLAFSPTGVLYGVTYNTLYEIDPVNGIRDLHRL